VQRIYFFAGLCLLLSLLPGTSLGQYQFRFNETCVQAYQHILALRIKPAIALLAAEKKADPNNLVPHFLEHYIDFLELFFNEDPTVYKRAKPMHDQRLQLLEKGPAQSPLTLFSQAIIKLQWAAVEIKFDKKWAAGWAFRDAYKLSSDNAKKFPSFAANGMVSGPMQMAASTVPKGMKWMSNLMGISGTMAQGKAGFDRFMNSPDPWCKLFRQEGIFYQSYLLAYLLNEPAEALALIETHKLDLINNHLFAFMAANLNLNNKRSLQTQHIVANRAISPDYLPTTVWDFEMAYARLYQLQSDAPIYFNRFLQQFKGKFYVKDAWLKLSYHYYLAGDKAQYNRCRQQVLRQGATLTEADKRALKEVKTGREPNAVLLKARLLFDGGYAAEALKVLQGKSSADFADAAEQVEFIYRLARIYDDLNQPDLAIDTYKKVIRAGASRSEYFAARAALQCGYIYEKLQDCQSASACFQQCLDMEGHDYEDALEMRAKAGLQRCKGK
jgi:predicted negative regulator of RcsB-dependent stress response